MRRRSRHGIPARATFQRMRPRRPLLAIVDPADPKSAVWLDGTGYARR